MSPQSESADLSQVLVSFEALETVQAQLSALPEGPALDMGRKMIDSQGSELIATFTALPEETMAALMGELDIHQSLLGGYRAAQESIEKVGGTVPQEIVDEVARLESEITSSPELRFAQFVRGTGSYAIELSTAERSETVETPVEPAPTSEPSSEPSVSPASPEVENTKPAVDFSIEINQEGRSFLVMSGSKKKKLPLSAVSASPVRTDYSAQRAAALKILLEAPEGTSVNARDLWDGIYTQINGSTESIPTLDRDHMHSIRVYITETLKYGGQSVIMHNRKRGNTSGYYVNPNLKVRPVVDITTAEIQQLAALVSARQTVADATGDSSAPTPESASGAEALDDENRVIIEDLVAFLSFIDLHEIAADSYAAFMENEGNSAVARFLKSRHEWIELLAELEEQAEINQLDDNSRLSEQEIIDRRVKTLTSLFFYIDNPSQLQERFDLSENPNDDAATENLLLVLSDIFEHLQTFSSEERTLLKEFVEIKALQKIEELRGTFSQGSVVASIGTIYKIGEHEYIVNQDGQLELVVGPTFHDGRYTFDEEDFDVASGEVGPLGEIAREPVQEEVEEEVLAEETPPQPETSTNIISDVVEVVPVEITHKAAEGARTRRHRAQPRRGAQPPESVKKATTPQEKERDGLIDELIDIALSAGITDEVSPKKLYAVFNLQARDVRNAHENGHISREHTSKMISLADAVALAFRTRHGNTPHIQNPRFQKETVKAIERKVKATQQRLARERR